MPKFAVYDSLPQEDDPFYRLGTQILGYDVRARTLVPSSSFQESLGQLDEAWTAISQPYGFHLTISDAIDCHWSAIPLGGA